MKKLIPLILISVFTFIACGDGSLPFKKGDDSANANLNTQLKIKPEILREVMNSRINTITRIMHMCPTFFDCHKGSIEALRRTMELTNITAQRELVISAPSNNDGDNAEEAVSPAVESLGGSITVQTFMAAPLPSGTTN